MDALPSELLLYIACRIACRTLGTRDLDSQPNVLSDGRHPDDGPAVGERVRDYVYSEPPLVEVIAEIFWKTIPIGFAPGAAVDVAFSGLSVSLPARMEAAGYSSVERLAPIQAPPEMLSGQPILRFRRSPETWPVYQLGPGLFTCNHTPPYEGWVSFRKALAAGTDMLTSSWPSRDPITLAKLRLRYIDAFVGKFGYESDPAFLRSSLKVGHGLDSSIIREFCRDQEKAQVTIGTGFPIDSLPGSSLQLLCGPGQHSGSKAYVAHFAVELDCTESPTDFSACIGWFDAAHNVVRKLFEILTSSLNTKFGDKRVIPDEPTSEQTK